MMFFILDMPGFCADSFSFCQVFVYCIVDIIIIITNE